MTRRRSAPISSLTLALVGFRGLWRRYVFLVILIGLVLGVGGAGLVMHENFPKVVTNSLDGNVGSRLVTVEPSFAGGGSGELDSRALQELGSIPGVDKVSGHYFLSGDLVLSDASNAIPVTIVPMSSVVTPPLRQGVLPADSSGRVEVVIPEMVNGTNTAHLIGSSIPLMRNIALAPGETRSKSESVLVVGLVDEHWQLDGRNPVYVPRKTADSWLGDAAGTMSAGVPEGGFTRISVLAKSVAEVGTVLAAAQEKSYLATAGVQLDTGVPAQSTTSPGWRGQCCGWAPLSGCSWLS